MVKVKLFYSCLPECRNTVKPDVSCGAWCGNHYHRECVGISAEEAELTDWVCSTCQENNQTSGTSQRTVGSQDLLAIPSQELLPLQNEVNAIQRGDQSVNLPRSSGNIQLNEHIYSMLNTQENVSSSAAVQEAPSNPQNPSGPENPNPTPRQTIEAASDRSSQRSSQTLVGSQNETEYEIEAITNHKAYARGETWYFAKWKGYPASDNLWLPESSFGQAYDILEEYKRAKKLGEPTIQAPANRTYGSIGDALQNNKDIWNPIDKVIRVIKGFAHECFRDALPIIFLEKGKKPDPFDQVCLIEYKITHLVTGLYKYSDNILYVADGENSCFEEEAKKYFGDWGVEIKPISFDFQSGIDHCSSSAAAIAIEFLRQFARSQTISGDYIIVPKTQLDKIKGAMHKGRSLATKPHISGRDNVTIHRCPAEGCSYITSKRSRRAITMHQLQKHGSNQTS